MNRDMTERVEDLFCAACEIGTDPERRAFVDDACVGDEALRAAVLDLLDALPAMESFFAERDMEPIPLEELTTALDESETQLTGAVQAFHDEREIGEYIGPYRLNRMLGEGGIGKVYLAEQESPIRRKVALKTIKAGMDTRSVIARFEAERQMLAMMEHPNIAHVYDAGSTDAGLPYFVMELVDGVRITAYCDEQQLGIRQRLELFVQVVHAIQHAHQKGIIHRDIKPSNVLITWLDGHATPKVIDFGIAKATRGALESDRTVATLCEPFIGTPVYMSPEQSDLAELNVDIRSDIYSLGILLYELLAGEPPFSRQDLLQSGLHTLRRILQECEPPRPSVKFSGLPLDRQEEVARTRQAEPRRLASVLAGELDWIVMRAIEKDRERRYPTADALAEDVLRYLNHEPVQARPPGRLYRFRKMVRRNKGLFASIAAVSLSLVAGLGVSLRLYMQAEQARAAEARLRIEAEAREKITQAAVLLNRNLYNEAEALMEDCELPVIKPSLEASDVFFRLANWRVLDGHWDKGAAHMLKYARAVQVDKSDMTDEATRGRLCVAPALVVAGDLGKYNRFASETIELFLQTDNPVAADHVLKICTVRPLENAMLVRLLPFAQLVKEHVVETRVEDPWGEHQNAWRFLEIALFEFRSGHFAEAEDWARKSLERVDTTPSRIAASHVVLAMVLHQLNRSGEAAEELDRGAYLVGRRLPDGLSRVGEYGDTELGFWHDWVNTYILLQEARQLMLQYDL